MKCKQEKCDNIAGYRYTWPGQSESFVCQVCKNKLEYAAKIMGMFLQFIPLKPEEGDIKNEKAKS